MVQRQLAAQEHGQLGVRLRGDRAEQGCSAGQSLAGARCETAAVAAAAGPTHQHAVVLQRVGCNELGTVRRCRWVRRGLCSQRAAALHALLWLIGTMLLLLMMMWRWLQLRWDCLLCPAADG